MRKLTFNATDGWYLKAAEDEEDHDISAGKELMPDDLVWGQRSYTT